MLVKICGLLRPEDSEAAAAAGADMLGVIFARAWRRRTVAEAQRIFDAAPAGPERVGVFVDAPLTEVEEVAHACHLDRIQLGGSEDPDYCAALGSRAVKTLRLPRDEAIVADFDVKLFHFDTAHDTRAGGTGVSWDYATARSLARGHPVLLAGGLTPDNVATAIAAARPYGVDVASGVETDRAKDPAKIEAFVRRARAAFAALETAA